MAKAQPEKAMVSIQTAVGSSAVSSTECLSCVSKDADIRARHHLGLARAGGVDLLKLHLYQHYAQFPRITSEERREAIESLCNWVSGMMAMWSGFVDERTGAPLPWWEARAQTIARSHEIAAKAYDQAPEGYKARPGNLRPIVERVLQR